MKGFRYIIAIFFSLLIVFAGAGVAVIHCYCVSCRVVHECCEAEHDHHTAHDFNADAGSQEGCCEAIVYKVDLLKGTEQMPQLMPCIQHLSDHLVQLLNPLPAERLRVFVLKDAPPPPDARQYLALYSTLLI